MRLWANECRVMAVAVPSLAGAVGADAAGAGERGFFAWYPASWGLGEDSPVVFGLALGRIPG